MRKANWNNIGLSVAIAWVLSLGMMSPGGVYAAQVKKDVCHLEGTGDYHVINIAEPSWQTHDDHGDGDADGGDVPGMPGYVFDAECNVVSACPCNFSLAASEALAVDTQNECYSDFPSLTQVGTFLYEGLISIDVHQN